MCCFKHDYTDIFQDRANRRVAFVGVGIVEVLDKSFFAALASIELLSAMEEYRKITSRYATMIVLMILYLMLSAFHVNLSRQLYAMKTMWLQVLFTAIVKIALVLFLMSLLSITTTTIGWDSTGLLSLTLLTTIVIKLLSIAIAYFDLVDMSGDWSYLIEFTLGVILITVVLATDLFVIIHRFVATVAAGLGTFLSLVSLMDLHQNMSVNAWWWEKKMIHGCIYHVMRQYTLLWCVRVDEMPQPILLYNGFPQQQQPDVTSE